MRSTTAVAIVVVVIVVVVCLVSWGLPQISPPTLLPEDDPRPPLYNILRPTHCRPMTLHLILMLVKSQPDVNVLSAPREINWKQESKKKQKKTDTKLAGPSHDNTEMAVEA